MRHLAKTVEVESGHLTGALAGVALLGVGTCRLHLVSEGEAGKAGDGRTVRNAGACGSSVSSRLSDILVPHGILGSGNLTAGFAYES